MAEGEQNKPLTKTQGSVPPFAIVMIILVVIAGLGVTIFVFFKDKIKSAFSSKDDSNTVQSDKQVSDSSSVTDNLTDSVVNESEKIQQMGDTQENTTEPKQESTLTLPEETDKIVRPEI